VWRIVSVVTLMLMVTFVVQFVAPSRSAADQAEPVLQTTGAQGAWGYLENEAETLLASQGLSSAMSEQQARGLIRAYIFLRLVGIIKNQNPSPQDQAALSYLQSLVIEEQYHSAFDAEQTWDIWASNQLGCPNGSLDWLVWEGGSAACGFWQLFGETPDESAFTSAGFNDVWSSFSGNSEAAGALSDMISGTTYWGGVATDLPSGLTGQALSAADAIHAVVEGEFGPAVQELLRDLGSSIVNAVVSKGDEPADVIPLGIAAAVIAANASWNAYDVSNLAEGLQKEVSATEPASNPTPDLSLLTQSPGITELAYVVASQTLDGLMTQGSSPCSYDTSAGVGCYTYTFDADPDFQQTIYGSTPTPLPVVTDPPSDTDPSFELTELKGANPGATCDSPTVEPPASCGTASSSGAGAMPMWQTSEPNGTRATNGRANPVNADLTSARGVGPQSPVEGYTSFIHGGMFVTRAVSRGGHPEEGSWLYRPSIDYEAPDGTRWAAWYQDGSFLQTKLAAPIAGSVWTGYRASDIGGTLCEEEPTWIPDIYQATPTGELCLFESTESATGGQAKMQNLVSGDELMVFGARVVVKEVVGCWKNTATYTFDTERCSGNREAAVLDPGQAQIGSAFSWQSLVEDISGLSALNDPFSFSLEDPRAWLVTQLDTCAGRASSSCQSPSSDIANCSLPVATNPAQPWESTTCFRSSTITYTLANGSVWQAQLIAPPVAVPHQYEADADISTLSCCTSTKLVVKAAGGVLAGDSGTDISTSPPSNISVKVVPGQGPAHGTLALKQDGSFTYTPESGFGWNGPAEDTFTYEVCNSDVPTWEVSCSKAAVTITVRQAPPTADPMTIGRNTGGVVATGSYLSIVDYKYSDRQGWLEGATTFAWYRNGQPTGITGAEYEVEPGEEGDTITAVVTPTTQKGEQGVPATSNGITISDQGPFSYVAYPTDTLTCNPTPLYYPASPLMSTTCTATVTVSSILADVSGPADLSGTVSFRSTAPGMFDASSSPTATCSLGHRIFSSDQTTGTTTESCSASYTPVGSGSGGVVGKFFYDISSGGSAGDPGGFGPITDYQTANVPVQQSGPGGAVGFKVSGLSNAGGGTPQDVTVAAVEAYKNPAPGFTGTIHFTSSDPNAILPADYTFTSADQGTHTFGVTLNTANPKGTTVTATATAYPAIKGSQTVTISPGPAAKLVISGFKYTTEGGVTAGVPQKVKVTAEDAGGNVVTGYTGTVHFTSTDPSAILPADYTFTSADQGIHTFTTATGAGELVLKTASYATVGVSDGAIGGSANVTVDPAATSHFKIELENPLQPVTAGEPRTLVVTAVDHYGNVTPFYTGTVSFSSTDKAATLPSAYTFTDTGDGDYGVHEFSGVVLKTVGHGSQTITVADTGPSSVKGTISLPVLPGPTASLRVSMPALTGGDPAGASQNLTVTAVDAFGNITPSYGGTVTFGSTDEAATLASNYTFTSSDAGVHEFSGGVTLRTAGSQTVTATDLASSAITGSQTVAVKPGSAAKLRLSGLVDGPPGTPQTVTVTALDAYGNVATGYTGTIAFTSTDPAAVLPPNYTFTSSGAGVHTFTNGATLNTTGAQKVTVTDTVHKSISGVESVSVASSRFSVASGTLIEGQPGSVAVRDSDASDTISESGALPPGVSFNASIPGGGTSTGEGEGIFSGTPQPGSAGSYQVTLSVYDFSDPPAEYSETFTLTVLAPTPGASLQSSSSSLDATDVVDQVGFTPPSAVAEGGSISVTAPAGVKFSGLEGFGEVFDDTVNVYVAGAFVGIESPTVHSSAGVETLTVPVDQFSIGAGDQVYVDIADVDNPTVASSGTWTVATSSDTTPVAVGQESFAEKNGVAPFGASATPATAGASGVWYAETFVPADELRATDYQNTSLFEVPGGADSSITFTAPAGASFPDGCPEGYLTDATHLGDSQRLVCQYGPPSGNQVTYYVEDANVPAGDDVTVFLEREGGTNPSSPGPNQISVTTSSDPDPIAVPINITPP
jgi:hypothetical protein